MEDMEFGASKSDQDLQNNDSSESSDNRRSCWVCLACEDDEDMRLLGNQMWVKPCMCRGTSKWVHQICLQRWIDEKQRGNILSPVSCSQCNTTYVIVYPESGKIMYLLDVIESTVQKLCPLVALGMFAGTIYWTAVSHGSFTLIQVLGRDDAMKVMDEADPFFLLVSLPTIPIMLIVTKMVKWEDYLLKLWFRRFTISRTNLDALCDHNESSSDSNQLIPTESQINFTSSSNHTLRVVCGALLFPTISSFIGKLLFKNTDSSFKKAVLGGLTFVAIKGVLKTCYKHQLLVRQMHRKIMNYQDDDSQTTLDENADT